MPRVCAVIMAGGVGTRFWPKSREKTPKQFLEIVGKGTMIQNTVKRLEGFVGVRDVFIVTNRSQKQLVSKQLPEVPEENIIVEPVGRNTAPCIGLAALHVHAVDPNAVMVVLPSDHLIQNVDEFIRILKVAVDTANESKSLLTIGIKPTHPETGYGYIQTVSEEGEVNPFSTRGVLRVKTFAEKPNLATAERFLESGDFLWNSGMFVWRADAILHQIKLCLPDLHAELLKIGGAIGQPQYQTTLEKVYGLIRGISIDYGVMEKAERVYVIPSDFGWNDVGSWGEVLRASGKDDNRNSVTGKVLQWDMTDCLIHSPNKLVAIIGARNLIVINTDDALLICDAARSQEVKEIADYLKRKQMNEYL